MYLCGSGKPYMVSSEVINMANHTVNLVTITSSDLMFRANQRFPSDLTPLTIFSIVTHDGLLDVQLDYMILLGLSSAVKSWLLL